MQQTKNKQATRHKVLSWILQLAVFGIIFISISQYQQKDMLATGDKVSQLQLSLLSVNGEAKHYRLDNGSKETFIYFFAPWCSVCHASIDNLENIYRSNPDNIEILVVALDWRSIEEVDLFLSSHKLTMPVLLGTKQVQKNFQISAFPSYYLISRQAEVLSKSMGYTTEIGMHWRMKFSR